MDSPLISVIVPVYKVEAFLPQCVESILAQTYTNLEILLVDDGSPDNCGRICDEYAARDPRIRVLHKRNAGLSSARNAGLENAGGEYIGFVDSDDWLERDAYERLMDAIQKNNVPLACGGRFDVEFETGRKTVGLCPPADEVISGEDLVRRIFRWQNVDSAAWDKLYYRDLFREIRYPVGMVTEDVPTTYRIALLAGKAAMISHPVYNYRHRPGSITTSMVTENNFHFSRHTERILAHIRESYPSLEREARYLRVKSLMYDLMLLEAADEDSAAAYAERYEDSLEELRRYLYFTMGCSFFTKREKRDALLLCTGLYGPALSLHFRLKKRNNPSDSE